jgi:hypothetical protein
LCVGPGSSGLSTVREEHGLRLFENRVLRRIFGPKREEVGREGKLEKTAQ